MSGCRVSLGIFLLVSHGEDGSKLQKVRAGLKICICMRTYVFLGSSLFNTHATS